MANEPTRERLLAAATTLLARSGYRSLGVTELLEAANATSGSLYHHFPGGKQELAATAIRDAGQGTRLLMDALMEQMDPGEAIQAMFAAAGAGIEASQWKLGCPVGTPAADAVSVSPVIAAAIDESFTLWIDGISEVLVERGVDPAEAIDLARWAIASYEGAVLLARSRRDLSVLKTAATRLAVEVERVLS